MEAATICSIPGSSACGCGGRPSRPSPRRSRRRPGSCSSRRPRTRPSASSTSTPSSRPRATCPSWSTTPSRRPFSRTPWSRVRRSSSTARRSSSAGTVTSSRGSSRRRRPAPADSGRSGSRPARFSTRSPRTSCSGAFPPCRSACARPRPAPPSWPRAWRLILASRAWPTPGFRAPIRWGSSAASCAAPAPCSPSRSPGARRPPTPCSAGSGSSPPRSAWARPTRSSSGRRA